MNPLLIQAAVNLFQSIIANSPTKKGELSAGYQYVHSYRGHPSGIVDDSDVVIEQATGFPVARWSYAEQEFWPFLGFTIQGVPVFEADISKYPPEHHIWVVGYGVTKQGRTFPNSEPAGERRLWRDQSDWYGPYYQPVAMPDVLTPGQGPTGERGHYGPSEESKAGWSGLAKGSIIGALLGGLVSLTTGASFLAAAGAGLGLGATVGEIAGKRAYQKGSVRPSENPAGSSGQPYRGEPSEPGSGGGSTRGSGGAVETFIKLGEERGE